jgi:hypothetical protein
MTLAIVTSFTINTHPPLCHSWLWLSNSCHPALDLSQPLTILPSLIVRRRRLTH